MSEMDLVGRILDAFETLGVWAIRINCGMAQRRGYWIRLAPEGTPDIIGCLQGGRMFAVEVKQPGARTKPETLAAQEEWRRMADRMGILHGKVDTFEQAMRLYRQWTGQEAA